MRTWKSSSLSESRVCRFRLAFAFPSASLAPVLPLGAAAFAGDLAALAGALAGLVDSPAASSAVAAAAGLSAFAGVLRLLPAFSVCKHKLLVQSIWGPTPEESV